MLNPAINDLGRQSLSISGMTCASCARTIERLLARVPGVTRAVVDLSNKRALVEGSAASGELVATVEAAGYGAQPLPEGDSGEGESDEPRRKACC